MNDFVYDKTMENSIDVKLARKKNYLKWTSKPIYMSQKYWRMI